MAKSRDRSTLAQVAALAGVSIATASKVVNGRSDVSPATRIRVLEALSDTGYASPVARPGANGYRMLPRSDQGHRPAILVLVPGIETMYSATVLHGVMAGGLTLGVEIVARFGPGTREGLVKSAVDAVEELPSNSIGVIAVTHAADGLRLPEEAAGMPVVVIDPFEEGQSHWITVGATNWTGAKSATDHLLEIGHRRIGWIGGPRGNEASAERLHGYRAALQSRGVALDESIERHGDFEFEFGRLAAGELLQLRKRPTALVTANDEIAIGAMTAARDLGLRVPEDVSVTGFDDTPQASWSTPKLTSVRQPLADMGRMAVSMILDAVRGTAPESRDIQLVTRLILRESTAPPLG
jgi:LacI family transcriptional regulator